MTKTSKRNTNVQSAATSGTKPPYRILTLKEVEELPKNGYRVISTFTGCGGSCLGFKMAGFTPVWANEFIPAARDTYRANFPSVTVDGRDIRKIEPSDILAVTGLQAGEADLLEGSPPCASFSMAGKRNKHWGDVKQYSDTKQRTDDLFWEYARLVNGLQPKVFVAENVSGLVKGKARGYFKEILRLLKDCGYKVAAQVLDAQWLGVPQARQRVIFVGVRNDLNLDPVFPKPYNYRYALREALDGVRNVVTHNPTSGFDKKPRKHEICPTVQAGGIGGLNTSQYYVEKTVLVLESKGRGRKECSIDEPAQSGQAHGIGDRKSYQAHLENVDISRYAIGKEWDKLKPGEQSDKYFQLVKPSLDKPYPTILTGSNSRLQGLSRASVVHPTEKRKFTIEELKRICSFPEDFKLTGTYNQQWERLGRSVPPLMMKAIAGVLRDEVLAKCEIR